MLPIKHEPSAKQPSINDSSNDLESVKDKELDEKRKKRKEIAEVVGYIALAIILTVAAIMFIKYVVPCLGLLVGGMGGNSKAQLIFNLVIGGLTTYLIYKIIQEVSKKIKELNSKAQQKNLEVNCTTAAQLSVSSSSSIDTDETISDQRKQLSENEKEQLQDEFDDEIERGSDLSEKIHTRVINYSKYGTPIKASSKSQARTQ